MDKMNLLVEATKMANKILIEKLPNLEYYNEINLNKNVKTLDRVIADNILEENQLLAYSSKLNKIILDEGKINLGNISVENLAILILHEYIHMASTDYTRQIIGFESEILPKTYNEALTQWLTLKLFYGDDKLENAVNNNIIYPNSVRQIDRLIRETSEKEIFNHFFEADINKNSSQMSKKTRMKWVDVILKLSSSEEEKITNSGLQKMQDKINSITR